MYIDGEWIESSKIFTSYNPANGQALGEIPDGSREDAKAAINAAAKAFTSWSQTTNYQRAEYLYKAWRLMLAQKEDLARLMTQEQGKPLKAARNEVQYAADFLLWYAEEAKRIYGETIPSARADQRFMVIKRPVGVVAAITPWNYPVSMLTRKLAPALAAGCTVVLKPAEATPLCAIAVFKILEEAGLPKGVVNLVTTSTPAPVGEEFCTNPLVRKITFTGSTNVGKLISAQAAKQVKRVSLELGGHAPFIVFPDADPVHAAKGCALVKFLNTGQACISPNRIFVHQSIIEPFCKEFTSRLNKLKAGNGLDDSVSIGPLVNDKALEKVQNQVDDALAKGARLLCGGKRLVDHELDKGFFFAPTALADIREDMRIYREETFGPLAPVIAFKDEEEVIRMANDTNYGLAAYVYTPNFSRALKMMEALDFAIIGVNDINPTSAAAPFGGMKESGLGKEGGKEGIAEYLESKLCGIALA